MNSVNLTGRLTKDIDLKKTQNGVSVIKFTLAVSRRFKKDGEQQADFISCVAWDKTAEIMYQYVGKGSQIGLTGRLQTGSYDRNGEKVYTTDVVVEQFDFLESRSEKPKTQANPYAKQWEMEPEQTLNIDNDELPF